MKAPPLITTPVLRISPETWREVLAVEKRRKLAEERQRWADAAHDLATEARSFPPERANIHDL